MNKLKVVLFLILIFTIPKSLAEGTLFETLVSDAPKLRKMVNVCLDMLSEQSTITPSLTKTCSKSALTAMNYSALVSAFGMYSEKHASEVIDLYISKFGIEGLNKAQKQINEGAILSRKMLDIYYIMLDK